METYNWKTDILQAVKINLGTLGEANREKSY